MKVSHTSLTHLLFALSIFGYPIVGVVVALLGAESQTLSLPFRGAVFALSFLLLFIRNKLSNINQIDRLLIFFFFAYFIRLFWDSQIQVIDGADYTIIFFLTVVVIPTIAVASRAHLLDEQRLQQTLLVFGLIFIFATLTARSFGLAHNPWADQGYELNRLMFEALNPITIGRASGALVLVGLTTLFHYGSRRAWLRILAITGVAIGLFGVLLANSRGPIVALVFALCYISLPRPRLLAFNLVVGGGYILLIELQGDMIQNVLERFNGSLLILEELSQERVSLIISAWRAFLDSPVLGAHFIDPKLGLGYYPHNLFIESAMALGILGLTIFVVLNLRFLANVFFYERDDQPTLNALAIFFFVTSLFSGALWASSEFFLCLALSFALAKVRRSQASRPRWRRRT